MKAQVEALKQLALNGGMQSFGNELTIEIVSCSVHSGDNYWLVRVRTLAILSFDPIQLTTNMRQFSHLTFHRLEVRRKYADFEELYKKLQNMSNYSANLPRFPKKRKNGSENIPHFANVCLTFAQCLT